MTTAKKLPTRRAVLPSFDDLDDFVARFENALAQGLLDTHLPDLITVLDDRVRWYTSEEPAEEDILVSAFLSRVQRLRTGPPSLTVGDCYTVLGARYAGVVVRYIGPYQDGAKDMIEVVVVKPTLSSGLNMDVMYRIPRNAIDKPIEDPE